MNTRLKQFLAAENITQAQFADTIKVVRASVSHILAGRNNPSYDFIKAMMLNYPNLNIEWLIFGKGRMYKDSSAADMEQIFPYREAEDPSKTQEFLPEPEEMETKVSPIELISSTDNTQKTAHQRNVSKVIVLFDDGTYQEM